MDRTSELNSQFEAGVFAESTQAELPLTELALSMAAVGMAEVILA